MKIHFAHSFGCQEKSWAQISEILAEFEPNEEKMALETGWLQEFGSWYQTRSTRIRCADFKPVRVWPKGYTFAVGLYEHFEHAQLERVYKAYVENCGYADYCSPLTTHLDVSAFGVVCYKGQIVAFTKFHKYHGAMESAMFCWDYSEPKVSLGIAIQAKEVEYAKMLGLEHLYLGPGYEVSSIYKARFPGFEWWTGRRWSTNVDDYIMLCERDTAVRAAVTNFDPMDTIFSDRVEKWN